MTMDNISQEAARTPTGRDEIDLAEVALILWERKVWIILCTCAITMLGIMYATVAPPSYDASATIALKESGKGSDASRLFSQLGGMGGAVASQFGFGNTSLDRIEVLLKGHELAEAVIKRYDLMPVLFHNLWNGRDSSWEESDPKKIPTLRDGVKRLRENVLFVQVDAKKNLLKVGARFRDAVIVKQIVDYYLVELNRKIRETVITEADANRKYLESQMSVVTDPALIEKIHNMVAFEIEKSMLVSNNSFDVLESPMVPHVKSKPKKKFIVILSFLIGFFVSVAGVFAKITFDNIREAAKSVRT